MIKSRILRWTSHVARMEEGKPTGKRPLGRPRSIRMDLKEIGINMRNWVDSAQNRVYW